MKTGTFKLAIGMVAALLISSAAFAGKIELKNIKTVEVPLYKLKAGSRQIMLNMGYASSAITNKEVWKNKDGEKQVYEVDLIFTAYPKKKEDWITGYDHLLGKRIEALIQAEPSLGSDTSVRWNLVLQTQCGSEEEAQKLFHGAVLRFRYKNGMTSVDDISLKKFNQQSTMNNYEVIQNQVEGIVYGLEAFEDSTVFKAIDRNHWGRMLVVTDWTGSMYAYGAQVALWHRLNFDEHKVKGFIFFNDGNRKADKLKRVGNTGGIFYASPDNFENLLKVMGVVMKLGSGGDTPENNLEAVLKGIRLSKDYDEIVMIADNEAGVRDMSLLTKIKKPIRIVLCGVHCDQPIHPHYLEIARKTGGSVHTIEQDIEGLSTYREGQMIDINGIMYKVKKGKLVKLRRG